MTRLLEIREKVEFFYARKAAVVDMILRFALLLFLLFCLSGLFPDGGILSNVFVILFASLLGALLPMRAMPLIVGTFSVGFAFKVGVDAGLVLLLLYVTLYCLLLRFVPEDSLALLCTPPSIAFGLFALVPVVCGIRRRPPSILAIASGCFVWHVLRSLSTNLSALSALPQSDYAARIQLFLGSVLTDPRVILEVLALSASFVVTYGIRRTGITHAFVVGVVLGSLTCAAFLELGRVALGQSLSVSAEVPGVLLTIAIGILLQFFWFAPDFKRTESFDFMDDDYYYYVRVVPKERSYRRRLEYAEMAAREEAAREENGGLFANTDELLGDANLEEVPLAGENAMSAEDSGDNPASVPVNGVNSNEQ